MTCPLSKRAPSASNFTAKNRVWGFFENSNRTRPANRRKPSELRRKIRLTPTKTASGIPYWPSRDPLGDEAFLGRYIKENPKRSKKALMLRVEKNLYNFVINNSLNLIDVLGLDFTNNSSRPFYAIKDGKWHVVKPGETLEGEVDGFSIGTDQVTGKAETFKWIDCYDVTVTDNKGQDPAIKEPIVIELKWVGNKHTDGKSWKRKCACAVPRIAHDEQQKRGGQKPDANAEFGSNPPPIFDEWLYGK